MGAGVHFIQGFSGDWIFCLLVNYRLSNRVPDCNHSRHNHFWDEKIGGEKIMTLIIVTQEILSGKFGDPSPPPVAVYHCSCSLTIFVYFTSMRCCGWTHTTGAAGMRVQNLTFLWSLF